MSTDHSSRATTRRGFLARLLAAIGGGVAFSASNRLAAQDPQTAESEASRPGSQGYRETDHVRAYYDSARF